MLFLRLDPKKAMLEVPLNRGSYTESERGLGFMRQGSKRRPLYGLLLLALAGVAIPANAAMAKTSTDPVSQRAQLKLTTTFPQLSIFIVRPWRLIREMTSSSRTCYWRC
jgi:hypothetical protein